MQIAPCRPQADCPVRIGCGDSLFDGLYVVPRVAGETEVYWTLGPSSLRGELEFKLQIDRAGHNEAGDWEDVTEFAPGVVSLVDSETRSAGWYRRTYYRVVVRDSRGDESYSHAVPANQGLLNQATTRTYREIVRRESKRNRLRNTPTTPGHLLKVRYYGDPCTVCVDPFSGDPITDQCDQCYGVGYTQGYHPPFPCFNVDLTPTPEHLQMYEDQGPMIQGGVSQIRYLNIPPVHPWDVWVEAATDYRYLIGQIKPITAFGSLNVVCTAAAARLSFDHPVYRIDVR